MISANGIWTSGPTPWMRRTVRNGFLLALVWAVVSGADRAPVSVSCRVDKAMITIGDLIRYTVAVAHDGSVQVELPGHGANLGGFEIRDYRIHDPKQEDGLFVSEAEYTISTFFTGDFEIPPLTVMYRLPGDTTRHVLTTDRIKIAVQSVKPSEAGDIRDIKPPVEIPRNWWLIALRAGIGLAFAGLGLGGYFFYRRWKSGKGLLPVRLSPPRPPHEIALEALDRLKASGLPAQGEVKRFHIELSDIVRHYLFGRYFIPAMEMTTSDVLAGLSEADLNNGEHDLFRTFLEACDLVKFAKYIPPESEILGILDRAYEIVNRTKVEIEEPSAASGGEPGDIQPLSSGGGVAPEAAAAKETDV